MTNAFHEIERTVEQQRAGASEAIRALLASIHLESCIECSARLRSAEFLLAFQSLLEELRLCHDLASHNQ